MNYPSRPEQEGPGFDQNPSSLSAGIATGHDLNPIVLGEVRENEIANVGFGYPDGSNGGEHGEKKEAVRERAEAVLGQMTELATRDANGSDDETRGGGERWVYVSMKCLLKVRDMVVKFGTFVGPGFMIAVAYIDPGNYSTDVAAGATYRFKLLFIVMMSNVFAVFLQSLCIKLGSVSGLNLAEACRKFLPRWLNISLYIMAEAAIIATDISEVIGTAIAINLLIPKIPLVAGCALSICDVMLILLFYRPGGSMKGLRAFEMFVIALVMGVVICFCIQLSMIKDTSVGEVFRGFLPSSAIIQSQGLYQACGILGATVMPHSLYLGSGIVQARLQEYDVKAGLAPASTFNHSDEQKYQPSLPAIKFCLKYSVAELSITLFTLALFVNSAILIVAGASLSSVNSAANADLFGIYDLLSTSLAPAAGTIFALALLLSGISAGIICTIAGQMVSEGALNWSLAPWLRRLVTRSISITPSIIIAGSVGREGLNAALNGSQVALSVVLPFVSAPLIYFTCRNKYMTVWGSRHGENTTSSGVVGEVRNGTPVEGVKMRNHWVTTGFAVLVWLVITVMNIANLVLLGKGQGA
ncbi:natural resistance-associated macrophage protein [Hyaloscypha variabilis F]|uniref:Natural resistance-associated macrophage protein n=1 Tax=Hyaloscypha variabilis (strain UAMH 11265 / GT02V1 / F) TaxID=1149755 RepID=A0A2J6QS98_HYAVF|nr:natural resistance-associated macrophage protein [Hyaloscypha variabilis F]